MSSNNPIRNNISDAEIIEETKDNFPKKTIAEEVEIILTHPSQNIGQIQTNMVKRMKQIKTHTSSEEVVSFTSNSEDGQETIEVKVSKEHPLLPLLQYARNNALSNSISIEDALVPLLGFIYLDEEFNPTAVMPQDVVDILLCLQHGFREFKSFSRHRNVSFCNACYAFVCGLGDTMKTDSSLELNLDIFESLIIR